MASPQRENGHIDIANEIAEALARYRMSGTEWQVLWVILRHTWGWHKKDEFISYGIIAEKTGLNRRNVMRTVQGLANKKILVKNGERTINNLKFNKDYESWQGDVKNDTTLMSKMTPPADVKNDTITDVKNDTTSIYVLKKQKETIKTKRKEYKEKKVRFMNFVFLTETEHKKLLEKLGEEKTQAMIESLNYYIGSKGDKYKSHYYTILQWLSMDRKRAAEKRPVATGLPFFNEDKEFLCCDCKRPRPKGEREYGADGKPRCKVCHPKYLELWKKENAETMKKYQDDWKRWTQGERRRQIDWRKKFGLPILPWMTEVLA